MKIKREIKNTSNYLKAIADPARLSVLSMLAEKEMYVGQMIKLLKIEPTLLSHHLSILKDVGLIIGTRKGKPVLYKLNPKAKIRGKNPGIQLGGSKFIF